MKRKEEDVAVLFDMDGVIVDTEPQYDVLWKSIGEEFVPEIPGFEKKIKGTVLPDILNIYFSHLCEKERDGIVKRVTDFELDMDFFEVPGAVAFIRALKERSIRIGLVTSSGHEKVLKVIRALELEGMFDTVVSSARIKKGKPDPSCYLLAASDLSVDPSSCYVLEDSQAGIAAGIAAGMKVVGLSTTLPADQISGQVLKILPDFRSFTVDKLLNIGCDS